MRIILYLCVICFAIKLQSQVIYSNEFLNIGVGARAHAMAGAVNASVDDANAAYWNSAALSYIKNPLQLAVMHTEWFGGVGKFDHISVARAFNPEKGRVGSLSLIRFGIDQIPNTLNLVAPDGSIRFENVSEFSAADYALLVSYASSIGAILKDKSIRLGGNIKIIRRLIGPFAAAWGFGLDVGLLIERPFLKIGIAGYDLSTTFTGWKYSFTEEQKLKLQKTGNSIPSSTLEKTLPHTSVGIAFTNIQLAKIGLLPELGFNVFFDGARNSFISESWINVDPKIGVEIDYDKKVFLRMGYGNIQKIKSQINPLQLNTRGQLHGGLGIKIAEKVQIDYALTNVGNLTDDVNISHIFSAILNFSNERKN